MIVKDIYSYAKTCKIKFRFTKLKIFSFARLSNFSMKKKKKKKEKKCLVR